MLQAQPPPGMSPAHGAEWRALRDRQEFEKDEFLRRVDASRAGVNNRMDALLKKFADDKAEFDKRVTAEKDALLQRHMQQDSVFFSSCSQTPGGRRAATAAPTDSIRMPPSGVARATATPARQPNTPKAQQPQQTRGIPAAASQTPQMSSAQAKPRARPNQPQRSGPPVVIDLTVDEENKPPAPKRPVPPQKPVVQQPVAPCKPVVNQPVPHAPSLPTTSHQEDGGEDCMIVDSDSSSSEPTQNSSSNFTIPSATFSLFDRYSQPRDLGVHFTCHHRQRTVLT